MKSNCRFGTIPAKSVPFGTVLTDLKLQGLQAENWAPCNRSPKKPHGMMKRLAHSFKGNKEESHLSSHPCGLRLRRRKRYRRFSAQFGNGDRDSVLSIFIEPSSPIQLAPVKRASMVVVITTGDSPNSLSATTSSSVQLAKAVSNPTLQELLIVGPGVVLVRTSF